MKTVFWNPLTFHPGNTLPGRLRIHAQSARYLMHLVVKKVAHNEGRPAHLKMEFLRHALGRRQCEPLLSSLIEAGDVKRVGGYKNGHKSFSYSPGDRYIDDKLRRFSPTDSELLDRLDRIREKIADEQQGYRLPIHDHWEAWQHDLRIDIRQARKATANLPRSSNPFGIQDMLVDEIRHGRHRFIVDPYGRVHNSITSLCRPIRAALRIEKQPIAGVDIVNSQPALLAWHMANLPPERGKRCSIINEGYDPGPLPSPSPGPSRLFSTQPHQRGKREFFLLASSGGLYEHLMRLTGLDRDTVKKSLMRDVFGSRYPLPVPGASTTQEGRRWRCGVLLTKQAEWFITPLGLFQWFARRLRARHHRPTVYKT